MRTQKPVTVNESAELLQAFVIVEFFSDISKRRNWVAHLSVVSNASGEWSFSKLGIVKGELRSSMGQERLSL